MTTILELLEQRDLKIGEKIGALAGDFAIQSKAIEKSMAMLNCIFTALTDHLGAKKMDEYLASLKDEMEQKQVDEDRFMRYVNFDG